MCFLVLIHFPWTFITFVVWHYFWGYELWINLHSSQIESQQQTRSTETTRVQLDRTKQNKECGCWATKRSINDSKTAPSPKSHLSMVTAHKSWVLGAHWTACGKFTSLGSDIPGVSVDLSLFQTAQLGWECLLATVFTTSIPLGRERLLNPVGFRDFLKSLSSLLNELPSIMAAWNVFTSPQNILLFHLCNHSCDLMCFLPRWKMFSFVGNCTQQLHKAVQALKSCS